MPVCADQITIEVTMGNLSMSRSDPCREKSEPTPAFDEITGILAPALRGNFDGPADTAEPRLFPMSLERIQLQDRPAYMIKIDAAGRAKIMMSGRTSELALVVGPATRHRPVAGGASDRKACFPLYVAGLLPACRSTRSPRSRDLIAGFPSGSSSFVR